MAKYIIDLPDEVPVSDGLVPFDMCRPSWYLEAYEKGKAVAENEVWEFAKKVRLKEFFDDNHNLHPYLDYFDSYQDAKAKHEELEKQKDKICIGDELKQTTASGSPTGAKCIVVKIDGDKMNGIKRDGSLVLCSSQVKRWWTKTGRHFPEVAELLKKMEEESDG